MTSEAILENPAFFHSEILHLEDLCIEYLDLAAEHNERMGIVKQHVFKFLFSGLQIHTELRWSIGEATTIDELKVVASRMKELWDGTTAEDKI